jgi:hypothetical protein
MKRMDPFGVLMGLIVIVALILLFSGCASPRLRCPPGYDADTTPGRDGSEWIGGE